MSRRKPSLIFATRLESRRKNPRRNELGAKTIVADPAEASLSYSNAKFLKTRLGRTARIKDSSTAQASDTLMAESGNVLQAWSFRRDDAS
jgi:hypothetical protein